MGRDFKGFARVSRLSLALVAALICSVVSSHAQETGGSVTFVGAGSGNSGSFLVGSVSDTIRPSSLLLNGTVAPFPILSSTLSQSAGSTTTISFYYGSTNTFSAISTGNLTISGFITAGTSITANTLISLSNGFNYNESILFNSNYDISTATIAPDVTFTSPSVTSQSNFMTLDVIPEPASIGLLVTGAVFMSLSRLHRKRR